MIRQLKFLNTKVSFEWKHNARKLRECYVGKNHELHLNTYHSLIELDPSAIQNSHSVGWLPARKQFDCLITS